MKKVDKFEIHFLLKFWLFAILNDVEIKPSHRDSNAATLDFAPRFGDTKVKKAVVFFSENTCSQLILLNDIAYEPDVKTDKDSH